MTRPIRRTEDDEEFLTFMDSRPSEKERATARKELSNLSMAALIDLHTLTSTEKANRQFGKPPGMKMRRSPARNELRAAGFVQTIDADPDWFGGTGMRTEDLRRDVLTAMGRIVARVLRDDVRRARRSVS